MRQWAMKSRRPNRTTMSSMPNSKRLTTTRRVKPDQVSFRPRNEAHSGVFTVNQGMNSTQAGQNGQAGLLRDTGRCERRIR